MSIEVRLITHLKGIVTLNRAILNIVCMLIKINELYDRFQDYFIASSSTNQHFAPCPSLTTKSGGRDCKQRSTNFGQRGAKRHPGGIRIKIGTNPGISSKLYFPTLNFAPSFGIERMRPIV